MQNQIHQQAIEQIYWAQRACQNWITLGDKNTKFFHITTTIREKQNFIQK